MKRRFFSEENVRKNLEGEGGLENEERGARAGGLTYEAQLELFSDVCTGCVYVNVPMYESKIYAVAKASIFQVPRLFVTTLLLLVLTLDP